MEDETLIRVLGDGIVDDAKRQQVVDAIVSAPTRADVEARKHKLGVIPDLLLGPEKRLVDIKTVCAKKYYRSGLIRGAAGSGEGRRKRKREDSPRQTPLTKTYGSPVDERALTVHREYFAKAVECDREYNIFDEDAMTGPMCRAIGGRGDVIGMAFGAVGEASSSVLDHAKACAEAISKEAMSEGDVDAVTKDTGYGRVLGEIIRDWGVACAKRRAECLIKLVSKTVPNLSTASGGGRLATDYNKFTRRCRVVAQSARRSAASYFGPTGLPGQAGGAQAGQPGLAHSPLFTHTGSGDTTRPGHVADDYNPQVPPQADPAPRPHGEDVTLDSDR